MEWGRIALASLYYGVCAWLVLYGAYRTVLLAVYLYARRCRHRAPDPEVWPEVTVQLPLYNERFVTRRLLEAVACLDYPPHLLHIQVLDDSTDCTARLARRLVAVLRRRGLQIDLLHRDTRHGFKAGALAAGLARARGEVLAIFDADFVPPRDFLRRTVPHLLQPGIGVVQARWGHLNAHTSWLTRMQAILLDGHLVIEQTARDASGCMLSFNGTCGLLRREAIVAAGGWTSDTVTEDLDLSIRMQLAGWRVRYLHDVVVPGEIPADANSFRSQQRRWTKGGVQVARKLLPRVLRSHLPRTHKLEALFHLTCYGAYPLLLLLALLRTPARVYTPGVPFLGFLPGEIELLLLGTLPLVAFYAIAQRDAGATAHPVRLLARTLSAMTLGAGLAVSNTGAVWSGLFGRDVSFERTPKRGTCAVERPQSGYRAPGTGLALVEMIIVVYLLLWKIFGTGFAMVTDLPFLLFFAFGLLRLAVPALAHWRALASAAAANTRAAS